ncbi:hypothetical protein, partial [Nodularia sphaerocarpa]|uniref:hypothetical protein n=1 Tax=Nodularia sphaerocarpa TaxID=137816 RepID=UPI00232E56F3
CPLCLCGSFILYSLEVPDFIFNAVVGRDRLTNPPPQSIISWQLSTPRELFRGYNPTKSTGY